MMDLREAKEVKEGSLLVWDDTDREYIVLILSPLRKAKTAYPAWAWDCLFLHTPINSDGKSFGEFRFHESQGDCYRLL